MAAVTLGAGPPAAARRPARLLRPAPSPLPSRYVGVAACAAPLGRCGQELRPPHTREPERRAVTKPRKETRPDAGGARAAPQHSKWSEDAGTEGEGAALRSVPAGQRRRKAAAPPTPSAAAIEGVPGPLQPRAVGARHVGVRAGLRGGGDGTSTKGWEGMLNA